MIEIKGTFTKGKERMKSLRNENMKAINKLEKKQKKDGYLSIKDGDELGARKRSNKVYQVSTTLPVTYKGITINGKLLESFLKKLKGMPYEICTYDDKLRVRYGKKYAEWTGTLELYDLTQYFEDFDDIPGMELTQ